MAIFDKLAAAAISAFAGELKATRLVLQQGIDTFRQANNMPLLYSDEPTVDEPPADPRAPKPIVGQGDYLTLQLLEDLAREQGVRYFDLPGLEAAARERGWVNPEGKLLMLPETAKGMALDDLPMVAR